MHIFIDSGNFYKYCLLRIIFTMADIMRRGRVRESVRGGGDKEFLSCRA